MRRTIAALACASVVTAGLVDGAAAQGPAPVAPAAGAAPTTTAAPGAKPLPRRFRVAYRQWRGRLKRHRLYVGRNLLPATRGDVRAADDATPGPTRQEVRHSIHLMQRRWARWLRKDPQGQVVAFRLKVDRQVPSWGRAHLRSIAWCESKNDPHAIGGGGAYRGMYQFSVSTWAVVGGSGDPAGASRWEQTWRAWLLLSRHGSGHWPVCG
jgi:hypothetical protein